MGAFLNYFFLFLVESVIETGAGSLVMIAKWLNWPLGPTVIRLLSLALLSQKMTFLMCP